MLECSHLWTCWWIFRYGHIHFDTRIEAAQFYYEMNGRLFDAPEGRDGNVKFSHALYFNSKGPVEY